MLEKYQERFITKKDMEKGKELAAIYENLSEDGKLMVSVYLSALRDKEMQEEQKAM